MEKLKLTGKKALVTGAARNLGKAYAEALACAGADVLAVDLDLDLMTEVATDISKTCGTKVIPYKADVTSYEEVQQMMAKMITEFGRIDICVANAGIFIGAKAEEMTPEVFNKIMAVNLYGAFYTAQAAGQQMIKQKSGSIIFTTSLNVNVASLSPCCAYTASKGALVSMCHDMAMEWGKYNVRVNCLSPGNMNTDMLTPAWREIWQQRSEDETVLGRLAEPYEMCGALIFLASDAGSYATGSNFIVDGGYTVT